MMMGCFLTLIFNALFYPVSVELLPSPVAVLKLKLEQLDILKEIQKEADGLISELKTIRVKECIFRVKTERYNKRSIDDNSEYKDVVSGSKNWDDGGIEIVVGGDGGLDCISEALRFIADTLDEQTAASKNGKYVSGEYSKSENRIVYPCIVRKKGSENINKNMMELLDSYTQNM